MLICAAGVGARAGGDIPKQYQNINGLPMLWHTLRVCASIAEIERVYVVVSPEDTWFEHAIGPLIAENCLHQRIQMMPVGGATRAESVCHGLAELDAWHAAQGIPHAWVMVHDAARPCLQAIDVLRLRDQVWLYANSALAAGQAWENTGGILARPITDTVKYTHDQTHIKRTIDRNPLWGAQTPQMFELSVLYNALSDALTDADIAQGITDEASVMEWAGHPPLLVQGDGRNIKVTYPHDFELAGFYLRQLDGLS